MDTYTHVEAYFGLLADRRVLLEGNVDMVMVGAVKNLEIARNFKCKKWPLYTT